MESLVVVEEETVAAMAAMAVTVETAALLEPIARTRTTLALPGRQGENAKRILAT